MTVTTSASGLQTEFPFALPRGYVDRRGRVHREGRMRLATARDEIAPQSDVRVRSNPAYLTVLLLARTVTHLEGIDEVDTDVVEGLFAADLGYLQDLYQQVNRHGDTRADVACPRCGHGFTVDPFVADLAPPDDRAAAGEAVGEW